MDIHGYPMTSMGGQQLLAMSIQGCLAITYPRFRVVSPAYRPITVFDSSSFRLRVLVVPVCLHFCDRFVFVLVSVFVFEIGFMSSSFFSRVPFVASECARRHFADACRLLSLLLGLPQGAPGRFRFLCMLLTVVCIFVAMRFCVIAQVMGFKTWSTQAAGNGMGSKW